MTQLLALVDVERAPDERGLRLLLARTIEGGDADYGIVHPSPGVVLAAMVPHAAPRRERAIAEDGRFTVVAHATLHYRADLARALEGAGAPLPETDAPAVDWILAAMRAWGEDGLQRLEGDFSFIAWDAERGRLFAARDLAGTRTLFHTASGRGIAVGTFARTLRRVEGVPSALNLVAIAEDASDVGLAYAHESPFTAIARIPAGHALGWGRGDATRVARWWQLPYFDRSGGPPLETAAGELFELLARATEERLDPELGTAILLSGGYDSTAVFGAGEAALARRPLRAMSALHPVSVSHAPGDPGREDELIAATTNFWQRTPTWVSNDTIPEFDDPLRRAARRDEPFVHTYELWNRALAETCRTLPARVALNGLGGDFWFSLSPIFLADHLRRLQLRRFVGEWRQLFGRLSAYQLFRLAVRPNLPPWLVAVARRATGRTLGDTVHRRIPSWVRADFARQSGMDERRYVRVARRRGESLAGAEQSWYLQSPFMERVSASVDGFFADAGVEVRSPLMDGRVIRYAATRPYDESFGRNGENKRLLRAAVREVLPPEITAPRSSRTGLPVSYFHRTVRAHLASARESFRDGMRLADLGIVDPGPLLGAMERYLGGADMEANAVVALSYAAHAEWWLRSEP